MFSPNSPLFAERRGRRRWRRVAGIAGSVVVAGAWSAAFAESAAAPAAVGASTGALVQGLLGLAVIIALLLVSLAALRRWGGRFGGVGTAGIKVLSGISVGPRERILLVEVGDSWLVLGVTASQIRTLHTVAKGSIPELAAAGEPPNFAHWLGRVIDRKKHEG